jgi:hypothetical protein
VEAVISGGIINVGNVNGLVVDADALCSTVVVDGEDMFGGKVGASVIPVDVEAVISAGIVNAGNVNGSVVDTDALCSMVVVDGEDMFGGRMGVSAAEVSVEACEVGTLSGLKEPIDIVAVVSFPELNVRAFSIDTFGVRTLSGLEASINVAALSVVSSAFGMKDFRTDCAVCIIFFSAKSLEKVGYSRYTESRNFE